MIYSNTFTIFTSNKNFPICPKGTSFHFNSVFNILYLKILIDKNLSGDGRKIIYWKTLLGIS